MKIYKNVISNEFLNELTAYFNSHPEDHFTPWRDENGMPNDFRCVIKPSTPIYSNILEFVKLYFPNFDPFDLYMAYQRQYNPPRLHMDPFGTDWNNLKYTMVIPILSDSRLKTFVFKNRCNSNEDWTEVVKKWHINDRQNPNSKISNLSEIEDLEHTKDFKSNDYIVDYMELDGTFAYERGSFVVFECQQIHCASNWRKYPDYEFKDIMQIHISDLSAKI